MEAQEDKRLEMTPEEQAVRDEAIWFARPNKKKLESGSPIGTYIRPKKTKAGVDKIGHHIPEKHTKRELMVMFGITDGATPC
jgi:hypothetical protein